MMSRKKEKTPVGKRLPPEYGNTFPTPVEPYANLRGLHHVEGRPVNGSAWTVEDDTPLNRYITLYNTYLLNDLSETKFRNVNLVDTGKSLTKIPEVRMFRVEDGDENADLETYYYFCGWAGGGKNGHKLPITYEASKEIDDLEEQDQLDLMRSPASGGGKKVLNRKNSKKSKSRKMKKTNKKPKTKKPKTPKQSKKTKKNKTIRNKKK